MHCTCQASPLPKDDGGIVGVCGSDSPTLPTTAGVSQPSPLHIHTSLTMTGYCTHRSAVSSLGLTFSHNTNSPSSASHDVHFSPHACLVFCPVCAILSTLKWISTHCFTPRPLCSSIQPCDFLCLTQSRHTVLYHDLHWLREASRDATPDLR